MNECHISRSHILSSPAAYHFFLSGTSLSTSVPETPHHNTPQTKTAFSLSLSKPTQPNKNQRNQTKNPFLGFFLLLLFFLSQHNAILKPFFFKNPLIFSHQESVMHPQRLSVVVSSFIFYFLFPPFCLGIRSFPTTVTTDNNLFHFTEAPDYRNGARCPKPSNKILSCDPSLVHIAMTLDSGYLRGSIAAVHSVLRHSSCPENIFFHFISAEFDPSSPRVLTHLVRSVFPSLNFKVYIFREDTVINLISSSIRQALENPLNYARNYLGDMLDACVERVIYLDSDIVVVDDVNKLWSVKLSESRVIGAPEYCHANFTKYFTDEFWVDPVLSRVFAKRKPCYFNTGVMVMDLVRWREGNYRKRIENWMELQKKKRIYELGSLPPFLLVFAGNVEGIDHRWNQHGLGGDNLNGVCRSLHPGPVSLLHWSGKGKPWVRLDEKKPCPLDRLWEPYDLYKRGDGRENQIQSWSFSSSVLIGYAHDLL